jgi:hypothetical protein
VGNLLTISIFLMLSASSGGIPAVPKSTELKTVIADSDKRFGLALHSAMALCQNSFSSGIAPTDRLYFLGSKSLTVPGHTKLVSKERIK